MEEGIRSLLSPPNGNECKLLNDNYVLKHKNIGIIQFHERNMIYIY